jgi:hypothetical protein
MVKRLPASLEFRAGFSRREYKKAKEDAIGKKVGTGTQLTLTIIPALCAVHRRLSRFCEGFSRHVFYLPL